MKVIKIASLFAVVFWSSSLLAETVAITNTTVFTGTEQGVLTDTTIIIEDGVVKEFNPAELSVDRTIDGEGKVVTPGFIAILNTIGLVEVGAVARSLDATPKNSDIRFDPSSAFNPESTLIPFARKGGITHSLVVPKASDNYIAGQAFSAAMNSKLDSVIATHIAVIANFGSVSEGSRASSLLSFNDELTNVRDKLEKQDDKDELKAGEKLLAELLKGQKPLVASVSRASDILQLIKIKQEFGINLVIANGSDAVTVKQQLAKAKVPVIITVTHNLPASFDSLRASLNNAAELEKAGVTVLFTLSDSHLIYNLRLEAGNAVAYGMSKQGAISGLTDKVAEVFNLPFGRLKVGAQANLVLWSGDPLEISSKVDNVWIAGEESSTESRQDKLRQRYRSKESKPRAYIK